MGVMGCSGSRYVCLYICECVYVYRYASMCIYVYVSEWLKNLGYSQVVSVKVVFY